MNHVTVCYTYLCQFFWLNMVTEKYLVLLRPAYIGILILICISDSHFLFLQEVMKCLKERIQAIDDDPKVSYASLILVIYSGKIDCEPSEIYDYQGNIIPKDDILQVLRDSKHFKGKPKIVIMQSYSFKGKSLFVFLLSCPCCFWIPFLLNKPEAPRNMWSLCRIKVNVNKDLTHCLIIICLLLNISAKLVWNLFSRFREDDENVTSKFP